MSMRFDDFDDFKHKIDDRWPMATTGQKLSRGTTILSAFW